MQPHPKGARARVLLSSVFKPFAQDDEFGSRAINPVELYHNQVTREQGPFSLRMFHRTWSLMLLQQNISAPCTVLDFPTRERFVRELTSHPYDIVGLTGIIVNVGKVREMCRLVRRHSPHSTLVVGGHVTAIPGIKRTIDADHIVKGEGVAWLRAYLGEEDGHRIEHPLIPSSFGFRLMGLQLLHDLRVLWRQGQDGDFPRTWRRRVSRDVRGRGAPGRPRVLHDGRELPAL